MAPERRSNLLARSRAERRWISTEKKQDFFTPRFFHHRTYPTLQSVVKIICDATRAPINIHRHHARWWIGRLGPLARISTRHMYLLQICSGIGRIGRRLDDWRLSISARSLDKHADPCCHTATRPELLHPHVEFRHTHARTHPLAWAAEHTLEHSRWNN